MIATLYYNYLTSKLGTLLLAASKDGLVYIGLKNENQLLHKNFSHAEMIYAPQKLINYSTELSEYFNCTRQNFSITSDTSNLTQFEQEVLAKVRQVPYGKTISYQDLAASVGNTKAVRAVAHAVAQNPLLFVIPCHRIIRSDGQIGKYRLGTKAKTALINLEKSHQIVNY